MFKKKNGIKRRKLNMNKHKAMIIPDRICQNNQKLSVAVYPIDACKLEFADSLWLTFIDQ